VDGSLSTANRRGGAANVIRSGKCERSLGWKDRASRWAESQPRVVLAKHCVVVGCVRSSTRGCAGDRGSSLGSELAACRGRLCGRTLAVDVCSAGHDGSFVRRVEWSGVTPGTASRGLRETARKTATTASRSDRGATLKCPAFRVEREHSIDERSYVVADRIGRRQAGLLRDLVDDAAGFVVREVGGVE
jgi:hypothetical protein